MHARASKVICPTLEPAYFRRWCSAAVGLGQVGLGQVGLAEAVGWHVAMGWRGQEIAGFGRTLVRPRRRQ